MNSSLIRRNSITNIKINIKENICVHYCVLMISGFIQVFHSTQIKRKLLIYTYIRVNKPTHY